MGKRSQGLVCDVTVIVVCPAGYVGKYDSLHLVWQEWVYSVIDARNYSELYRYTRWDGGTLKPWCCSTSGLGLIWMWLAKRGLR